MGLDDLVSTESAVVATATAAVFSPRTRETLRKGAVLGVAGVLKVGDVVTGAARGVVRGVKGEEELPTPASETVASPRATPPAPGTVRKAPSRPRRSTAANGPRPAGSRAASTTPGAPER